MCFLVYKLCVFLLPPAPSICPDQCGQDKWHHTPVSLSGDRSCKCLLRESLLTSLLTQTALIQETASPRAPMHSKSLCLLGYFSLSPCFCSVNFFHWQWPSLSGSPRVILNGSIGSTSLISQPTHGILATFFSLEGRGPSCSLMLSNHDFHWSPR